MTLRHRPVVAALLAAAALLPVPPAQAQDATVAIEAICADGSVGDSRDVPADAAHLAYTFGGERDCYPLTLAGLDQLPELRRLDLQYVNAADLTFVPPRVEHLTFSFGQLKSARGLERLASLEAVAFADMRFTADPVFDFGSSRQLRYIEIVGATCRFPVFRAIPSTVETVAIIHDLLTPRELDGETRRTLSRVGTIYISGTAYPEALGEAGLTNYVVGWPGPELTDRYWGSP